MKFTFESEKEDSLNFLDVKILIIGCKFETRWYRKPIRPDYFYFWNSSVPEIYKRRLVYTMMYRLKKICSKSEYFDQDLKILEEMFLNGHMPRRLLKNLVRKI